jgi:hypothetical protein
VSRDDQQQHVALPRLYGQPAYARPPRSFETSERPPDPDDLPLEVVQTDEERQLVERLRDGSADGASWRAGQSGGSTASGLRPRPFSLRTIGRLFGTRE